MIPSAEARLPQDGFSFVRRRLDWLDVLGFGNWVFVTLAVTAQFFSCGGHSEATHGNTSVCQKGVRSPIFQLKIQNVKFTLVFTKSVDSNFRAF